MLDDFIGTFPVSSTNEEPLHATFKGNEDMWFIKRLFDMNQAAIDVENTGSLNSSLGKPPWRVRLADRSASMRWAAEELFDPPPALGPPVGVYHTMRSMPDDLRSKVISSCPEVKRLFDSKHERGEKKASPAA